MTIYHTSGIRRYLIKDELYTYGALFYPMNIDVTKNTKSLLRTIKRKKK